MYTHFVYINIIIADNNALFCPITTMYYYNMINNVVAERGIKQINELWPRTYIYIDGLSYGHFSILFSDWSDK